MNLCSRSLMIAYCWLLPLSAAAQGHAQAQQYPSKPVTITSDSGAGSTPDVVLLVIAHRLVAPIGTPETIIRKVSEELRKVVTDADFKKKIAARGMYTQPMSPAETIAFVQVEQRKWNPVLELIANKTN